jgi:hypothetical protein
MGDWKAFRRRPGAELEIYNLKQDVAEKSNVAALHPQIVGRILDYLQLARTDPKPRPNRSTGSKRP